MAAPAPAATATSPALYAQAFLLGVGLLTPFNMTLNLIPFLAEAYAWPEVAYYTSLCLTYPSILVQFVLLPCGQRLTPRARIRGSLACGAVALLLLGTAAPASRALGLLLMLAGGACTAVLEGSLFGWLARFPDALYSQAAMAGVALAGVLATLLQLLLRALLPGQTAAAAGVFTAVGVGVLGACIAAHARMAAPPERAAGSASSAPAPCDPPAGAAAPAPAPFVKGVWPEPPGDDCEGDGAALTAAGAGAPLRAGLCGAPGLHAALLHRLRLPLASLVLTFVATFCVFPGLIASVPYKGGGGGGGEGGLAAAGEWFIVQLLVFGVSDAGARGCAARSAAGAPPSQAALLAYALARFALVPLLAACACGGGAAFGDGAFTALVALLGGSGGHLASLLMMHAPRLAGEGERETAGLVLVAALHVGIVAGSNLALFFEGAAAQCRG